MSRLIWYANNNLMPSPSSYKINWEDLDKDSYRSVTNGNLIRNVLKRRWAKIGMSWRLLSASDVNTILSAVNQDNVTFKVISPAFASGYMEFKGYVSKMEAEMLETTKSTGEYSLSFNIVQMEGAPFQ